MAYKAIIEIDTDDEDTAEQVRSEAAMGLEDARDSGEIDRELGWSVGDLIGPDEAVLVVTADVWKAMAASCAAMRAAVARQPDEPARTDALAALDKAISILTEEDRDGD